MKDKRKFRDVPEKIYCYLCDGIIHGFSTPEAERRFAEQGLCEKCQKQIAKAAEKEGI
jgi:hypothetical protein